VNDPINNLGFLLNEVHRMVRRDFNERVRPTGLTQGQWRALAYVSRMEGVNQARLAERMEIRPITLGRLIDRLQEAGWVERRADPGDRRMCRLYLTPAAQPLIRRLRTLASETLDRALAGIGAQRRTQLVSTLKHIKENLSENDRDSNH